MIRIIGGTILGFFLSGLLNNLIGETDLYYSSFYNEKFAIILAVMCALIGGYVGSKFNQHYAKQVKVGRVMNKNAQYAGKSMVVAVILFLFTVSMSDVSGSYGLQYVFLLAFAFLILALFFAIKSISETRKTNEMGIFYAVLEAV